MAGVTSLSTTTLPHLNPKKEGPWAPGSPSLCRNRRVFPRRPSCREFRFRTPRNDIFFLIDSYASTPKRSQNRPFRITSPAFFWRNRKGTRAPPLRRRRCDFVISDASLELPRLLLQFQGNSAAAYGPLPRAGHDEFVAALRANIPLADLSCHFLFSFPQNGPSPAAPPARGPPGSGSYTMLLPEAPASKAGPPVL